MRLHLLPLWTVLPLLLHAESQNPHIRFTGAPTDGGQNCSSCHSTFGAANSDTRGSVSIDITQYNPGVSQMIHVTVSHPTAVGWGFQMTARTVTDETQEAGNFASGTQVQVRCDDGSAFGAPGPCSNTREFAEHDPAPKGVPGSFTFIVPWTPPVNEVGDIRFYVSAVAADGDATAQGDRVYTTVVTISPVGACTLTSRPSVRTAVNGASFQPPISSNAMMTVFGANFQVPGRTRLVGGGDIQNGQFPTQLACVEVLINNQPVPIAYIQQDQINIQAPSFTGTAPLMLVIVLNPGKPNELRSDIATLNSIQTFAPAFFLVPGGNSVAAQFANT
ncbi:MAG: hypothetical protein JO022_18245, partial [Acidobacteriaceae bacterium]|nr:hypothetical protein [Acidobacteriaceae bacterium]